MLVIYARDCVQCRQKRTVELVQRFARTNGLKLKIKRTVLSAAWREEAANRSDVELPYIYNEQTKSAVHLLGITQNDLQSLL